ncbi:MAG: hypothetical protein IT349_19385 [Candidatus Eisenbacteria bacterium]|nr:hypothetical protein [Candidatus Eisenbacteria bacterium]
MAVKNLYGKSRKVADPYWVLIAGDWTWKVLKLYKSPESSLKDPFSRAFCAVSSPHTFGSYDLGDVYVKDIPGLDRVLRGLALNAIVEKERA